MKTIYKYPLNHGRPTALILATDYRIVHVGIDGHNRICVWVEFSQEADPTERLILDYVGTGWDVSDSSEYIGTAITSDGFVWHVYKENHGNT